MPEFVYEVPSNVICQVVDQDLVVLNMDTEVYYSLDSIGKDFWDAALETPNATDAITPLLEKYDANEQTLRKDFLQFTEKLMEMGLLTKIEG